MRSHLISIVCLTLIVCNDSFTSGPSLKRRNSDRNILHRPSTRQTTSFEPKSTLNQPLSPIVNKFVVLASKNSEGEGTSEIDAERADKIFGILVLLTVPLAWGTYVPVVRYLYAIQPPVPGFVFSACYYALASVTTTSLALWQGHRHDEKNIEESNQTKGFPVRGGFELGSYLFIANCLQVVGLQTVESDRAGFLVQLTTVFVPFVEALFGGKLSTVPARTWFACIFAFIGLFVMGLDGKNISDPVSTFVTALSSFTKGDALIIGAAVLYTLHVVRLGVYARETTPMRLAASKATAETIFSIVLVGGLATLSSFTGEYSGLFGFAVSTGKEIVNFFSSFYEGIKAGILTLPILLPAIGAICWTGWITCAYTIYAQSFGQSRVSPTNANLVYTFQPIFTALFGWLLLGETMGSSGFLGGAIIAASVYMVASVNMSRAEDNASSETESILKEAVDIELDSIDSSGMARNETKVRLLR